MAVTTPRVLALLLSLTALPAEAQVPEADAVIDAFYEAVRGGDLDAAYALTDGSTARGDFDKTWTGFDEVEVYLRFTGEVYEGLLLGHVDHCVGPRDATYSNWAGQVRLKKVAGAWKIHDWDDDTMAYSIGDDCWAGGQMSMLGDEGGGALIGAMSGSIDGESGGALGAGIGGLGTGTGTVAREGIGPTEPGIAARIELVEVAVEGGRTNAEEVVRRRLNALRYCYERRLQDDPELAGAVELTFTVTADGGKTAGAAVAQGIEPSVDGCMLRQVGKWRFKAPEKPTKVRVKVALTERTGE